MKLDAYLKTNDISEQKFAEQIGVSQQAVHRYRTGRVPTPEVMQAIIKVTAGAVTADDFFDTSVPDSTPAQPDSPLADGPAAKDAAA